MHSEPAEIFKIAFPGSADDHRLYQELHESDHRYRQIFKGLPAALYTCDAEGRIQLYNDASTMLWGREPEVGKDLWCGSWKIYRTDGTPLPLDSCPMAIALKEGRAVYGEEIVIERPDGAKRNVLPHPKPIFNASGTVVGAVNMLVDITDLRRTEEALLESEERFRTMADQAPIMICLTDEKNNSIYVNSKWTSFTGLPLAKGLGTGWIDLLHADDKEVIYQQWQHAFKNRQSYSNKFRYKNAEGEYAIISSTCSPRISIHGELLGYIVILNDITPQENSKAILENLVKDRTSDLIKANAELERSNLELEQFAYVASHDLQEPLRKIQAFSDMLQKKNEEKLDDDSKLYLNKITSSANRLSVLIDDLLNFSRISRPEHLFIKTDLNEVINKVKSDFELQITGKNAVIEFEKLPVIEAIPLQMNQLFHNLLSNSLKFASAERPPKITVSCKKLSKAELSTHSEFQNNITYYKMVFADNGIGFGQEFCEDIFMIFHRLHEQFRYSGSGIGLALCRKIVINHNGKIHAEGKENGGCAFSIILPEKHEIKNS